MCDFSWQSVRPVLCCCHQPSDVGSLLKESLCLCSCVSALETSLGWGMTSSAGSSLLLYVPSKPGSTPYRKRASSGWLCQKLKASATPSLRPFWDDSLCFNPPFTILFMHASVFPDPLPLLFPVFIFNRLKDSSRMKHPKVSSCYRKWEA